MLMLAQLFTEQTLGLARDVPREKTFCAIQKLFPLDHRHR